MQEGRQMRRRNSVADLREGDKKQLSRQFKEKM
jgi:hypothetical protein